MDRRINEDVEEEIAIVVAFSRLVDGADSVCLRVPRNAIERHRHPLWAERGFSLVRRDSHNNGWEYKDKQMGEPRADRRRRK